MKTRMIEIKYFDKNMPKLEQVYGGDWIDLRVRNEEHLKQGEYRELRLGVAMFLPVKCEALVIPRSSTFKKWGIIQTNSVGLIDNTYRGGNDEWKFPCIATREIIIPQYTRIAQFRILENQPFIFFNRAESLDYPDRNGFGSTGTI